MQEIVIAKPYRFVPPRHGDFWPRLFRAYLPRYLRNSYGVERIDFRGLDRLRASMAAGHGIMLAPNHCRPCDPMVVGTMTAHLPQTFYVMASWHLFMQSRWFGWLLPRIGAFSVYREGLDREALKFAVEILVAARRPLVMFAEGAVSRTNDRLNYLQEGLAFIARNAAKRRAALSPPGKVLLHPVAIRYFFQGAIEPTLQPVLEDIERRLSWQPQSHLSLTARIDKLGGALLTLKELEYFEQPQPGTVAERLARLIDRLLLPLEAEWLEGRREASVTMRVKALRTAILPELVNGNIDEQERARRWRQLGDLYLSQQLSLYPPDYFSRPPTAEQLLETVERFEEDLTDTARVHRPLCVVVEVGEAIEVAAARERGAESDPLMVQLRSALESMLQQLKECRP